MADENELQTADEIAAARREFLSEPPPVISNEPEPVVDDASLEGEVLDDLTKPPAAPEGAQPAPAPAPAPTGTPDPYAAFGGEEQVRLAHQVQEALRTEQGVRALVANGLSALGYEPEQIRQALEGAQAPAPSPAPAAAPASPLEGLEDDDVVTVGSMKSVIADAIKQAVEAATGQSKDVIAPVQDVVQQQQQLLVRTNTDAAVIEALGQVPTDETEAAAYRKQVDAIVARASAYYDPTKWADAGHIRQAVQRANAELNAESEERFQAYLRQKKQVRDSQPPHVAGGAGGEGPLPEPKSLAEARKQARDSGFFD
jgi:hypothetical protein